MGGWIAWALTRFTYSILCETGAIFCFITYKISYISQYWSISPIGKVKLTLFPQSSCIQKLAVMLEALMYERSDGMYYDGLR